MLCLNSPNVEPYSDVTLGVTVGYQRYSSFHCQLNLAQKCYPVLRNEPGVMPKRRRNCRVRWEWLANPVASAISRIDAEPV